MSLALFDFFWAAFNTALAIRGGDSAWLQWGAAVFCFGAGLVCMANDLKEAIKNG